MTNFTNASLLVTGASGHLGRAAVEELLARGASKVIAGTRDPAKLADLAERGVEIRKVDFNDPAGLPAAFAGVERLLIVSTDGIGTRIAQQTAAVEAAKTAGVKHIVYTSAPPPGPMPMPMPASIRNTSGRKSRSRPRASTSPSCAITCTRKTI